MKKLTWSQEDFDMLHRNLDAALRAFLHTKRGRALNAHELRSHLNSREALSLKAINAAARMSFSAQFSEKIQRLLFDLGVRKFSFVTLDIDKHSVPLREAASFDVQVCKDLTQQFLNGWNYIGIVEPAFYYQAAFVPAPDGQYFSWHTHAIVWETTQSALTSRRRAFNQAHQPFVPGCTAAHCRRIDSSSAESYARYMTKSIIKEYTAYPKMLAHFDPITGEITKQPSGRWRNRKRPIRPTNLVRAFIAMADRTIEDLAFAGGAGSLLYRDILRSTRLELRMQAANQIAANRDRLFGN
ncbi:hypothetical protein ELI20_01210 [Rhizobium ruizarguesonis]|jgi:hypothetical protein|uniref:hypothetical protein n=1 Tax=Rhizobium TaxID=379 RepID=UPI00103097A2|nr:MULTISPECIES: hypothetical protein [Rhizobium]QIO58711.1 hypothetical protein HA463_13875 [Rhizobium leguminosarum bv. trifolii]TAW19935.1 hypothetical protein ELI20_01210 [Rhizobium ruizarguesonis]TBC33810.1 hypothetical protein ELH33_01180 [Rhizobium ruizarguesonis]